MTTAESVITDEMRAAIGVEGPPSVMEIEKTNSRMFARSVGHTDPIFYDEAAAKARGLPEHRRTARLPRHADLQSRSGGAGAPGEMGGRGFACRTSAS